MFFKFILNSNFKLFNREFFMRANNQKKEIDIIEKDFCKISEYFENKLGFYWWFLSITRLDLALWGLPQKKFFKNSLKYFLRLFLSLITVFFFRYKKPNFDKSYIFLFEDFLLSNKIKFKEDYYFKKIRNFFPLTKNIVLSLKIYNDRKNYSIFQLNTKKDIFKIFLQSIHLFLKYLFLKNKIFKKTKKYDFWNNYQRKNDFINFYLCNLTYNFFKKNLDIGKKIIYPYEEKPYERALNSIRSKKFRKKIFAYQVNPKDNLGLYMKKFKSIDIPRPTNYLFPGIECAKSFLKNGRYNSIDINRSIIGTSKCKNVLNDLKKVYDFLILISHPKEYNLIINWLSRSKYFDELKFLIRFYPAANLKLFDLTKKKNFSYSKNTLLKDCQLSKFAIFGNTSAGIEAVNNGLIAIWADLTSINLSPLTENQKKFFYPSNNFEIFEKNIRKVCKLDKKGFNKKHKKQISISQDIYSNINVKNIKNILIKD